MRPIGNNLYELFIVRCDQISLCQGIFTTFPDIQEWTMNDVYSPHPDPAKQYLWHYRGRKDDVIVLQNGEKLTPATMEAMLMASGLIDCAMIVGEHQFQPAALIEPSGEPPQNAEERTEFIQRILPVLDAVNEHAPGHGQLDEHHIIFTQSNKPIVRLGQGKIHRRKTKELYETEIQKLYEEATNGNAVSLLFSRLEPPDFSDRRKIEDWLKVLFEEMTRMEHTSADTDFFEIGTDSLQVIRMARELKIYATRAGIDPSVTALLEPRAFYSHPTISGLANFIAGKTSSNDHLAADDESRATAEEMLESFARTLPKSDGDLSKYPITDQMTVVLTGSTGSLGSYLLDVLYRDQRVRSIICLNRSLNAAGRHADGSPKRGLCSLDPRRVEFLHGDLALPRLGLSEPHYDDLLRRTTHVLRKYHALIVGNS